MLTRISFGLLVALLALPIIALEVVGAGSMLAAVGLVRLLNWVGQPHNCERSI